MAYTDNFPQRAIFTLDAANAGRLDPRCSYSRSTTGTFFGTEKVLSSENLLLQSQSFDTSWLQNSGIATLTGSQSAPDGTSTAWLLTGSTASQNASIAQAVTLTTNTNYTITVFLKAGTESHAYVSLRGSGSHSANALIDFSAGTATATDFGDFTSASQTVTALGSGWYKLTLSCTTGSTVSSSYVHIGPSDGSTVGSGGYLTYNAGGQTIYAWGAQLNTTGATVYDSPTTTQIARSYQTKLQTAAINAPRFEYSATDGQSMGILIESAATNLLNYSEEFDNAYWSKSTGGTSPSINLTITPNAAISPSGELTADLVVPQNTGGNTLYFISKTYSFTSGNTYTLSAFVKSAGLTEFTLAAGNTATWAASTRFTLTGSGSASVSSGSATIESCGNGWYRCTITGTAGATTSTNVLLQCVSGGQNSFDGDDYSGVLLWGAQMEQASFASSYIKVEGSTATRAADQLSVATADIGYTGGPVALFAESSTQTPSANSNNRGVVDLSESASSNNRVMIYNRSGQAGGFFVNADNVGQALGVGGITDDSYSKVGVSVDTNSVKHCVNGGTVSTDNAAVIPDGMTTLYIGRTRSGEGFGGHIKRVALYNEALSDTNLQALTS